MWLLQPPAAVAEVEAREGRRRNHGRAVAEAAATTDGEVQYEAGQMQSGGGRSLRGGAPRIAMMALCAFLPTVKLVEPRRRSRGECCSAPIARAASEAAGWAKIFYWVAPLMRSCPTGKGSQRAAGLQCRCFALLNSSDTAPGCCHCSCRKLRNSSDARLTR